MITDGIFATIDERFFAPGAPPNPGSKLNIAIRNIAETYHATSGNEYRMPDGNISPIKGGTQMVFLDRRKRQNNPFDAYVWMRSELERLGVPAKEIAFATDFSREQKKERTAACKAGKLRVLIGSTAAMGEGTNGQVRLVEEHNLDAPWYPSAVEQRVGRIVRQNNQNEQVSLRAYALKGSYDASMWGILEVKQGFIDQALSEGTSIRSTEDMNGESDQYAVAKAMATGDPRILQKVGLEQDIRRLERQSAAHHTQQMTLRSERRSCLAAIELAEERLPLWERILATRDATEMVVRVGKEVASEAEAPAKLWEIMWALHRSDRPGDAYKVGSIGPFAIRAWVSERIGNQRIAGLPRIWIDFGSGLQGREIATRMGEQGANLTFAQLIEQYRSYPAEAMAELDQRRQRAEAELAMVDAALGAPFRYAEELAAKQATLRAIDQALVAESNAMRAGAEAAVAGGDDNAEDPLDLEAILEGARDDDEDVDEDENRYGHAAGM